MDKKEVLEATRHATLLECLEEVNDALKGIYRRLTSVEGKESFLWCGSFEEAERNRRSNCLLRKRGRHDHQRCAILHIQDQKSIRKRLASRCRIKNRQPSSRFYAQIFSWRHQTKDTPPPAAATPQQTARLAGSSACEAFRVGTAFCAFLEKGWYPYRTHILGLGFEGVPPNGSYTDVFVWWEAVQPSM